MATEVSYTPFEDYVARLRSFVGDERSQNKDLVDWIVYKNRFLGDEEGFQRLKNLKHFPEEELHTDFAKNFWLSKISQGNFTMHLYGDSDLTRRVVDDFKGYEHWESIETISGRTHGFLSRELGVYINVGELTSNHFRDLAYDNMHFMIGEAPMQTEIVFPGVIAYSGIAEIPKESIIYPRNIANAVIALEDYVVDKGIPISLDFDKSERLEREVIAYNPLNEKVSLA